MAGAQPDYFLHALFWLIPLFYLSLSRCSVWSFRLDFYWLYLDQSRVNFPIADAFEPGKPLLRGLDRPFGSARRSNDDRALAAAETLFVPGNFVDETHAIARHLSPSHPAINNTIAHDSVAR